MANNVYITYMQFRTLNDKGIPTSQKFRYAVESCDDRNHHMNYFDSLKEMKKEVNIRNLLGWLDTHHDELIETVQDEGGLYFNDGWASLEELEKETPNSVKFITGEDEDK